MTRLTRLSVLLASAVGAVGLVVTLWVAAPTQVEPDAAATEIDEALFETLFTSLGVDEAEEMSGPWDVALPRDLGAHESAGTETWSVTAHLADEDGTPFALTVAFTRIGPVQEDNAADRPWGPGPLYLGQATLIGADAEWTISDDRVSRTAGLAGHDADRAMVWVDDWAVEYGGDGLELSLRLGDMPLRLALSPQKAPIAADGVETAGTRAFAIPRLAVSGTLGSDDDAMRLTGTAWLDRLWGNVPLPGGPLLRDRLVVHLSDGSDLTLLRTQRRDGRGIATLDGAVVGAEGDVTALSDSEIALESTDVSPSEWRIVGQGLDLSAREVGRSTGAGLALPGTIVHLSLEGTQNGAPVTGTGSFVLQEGDGA